MTSDRHISSLAGEPAEGLPPYLRSHLEGLQEPEPPEPIHPDYFLFDDFHGHDRADERRWLEAEMGKWDDDPYERMVEG